MVQEATIILADNSEWMRNGDYPPNRFEAEKDAIRMIGNIKVDMNQQNTVGLITMAGRAPEILVTLTSDVGKILTAVHSIQYGDKCDVLAALRIAQLALKHRKLKEQRQRIILFVGSPIDCDEKKLVQLGERLKKNNVAVDIVNFGQLLDNSKKLDAFWKAVNSSDNSHLVVVPPGPHVLSDALQVSPIINGAPEDGFNAGGGGDVDDMRMAIEMSLLEEQQRLQRQTQRPAGDGAAAPTQGSAAPSETTPLISAAGDAGMDVDDEDALLAQALLLSEQTFAAAAAAAAAAAPATPKAESTAPATTTTPAPATSTATSNDDDDDEEMRLAMEMSMQLAAAGEPATPAPANTTASSDPSLTTPAATTSVATPNAPKKEDDKPNFTAELNDPAYLNSLFQDLPGVDFTSPSIQNILSNFGTPGTQDGAAAAKPDDKKDEAPPK